VSSHSADMLKIKGLLWEFREGPAVVGMKRDVIVKLLESCIANMEDLNVIEEYAKELGWHPDMNTTAAIWLSSEAMRAKVDGPVFNSGRMEGRDDVKVMFRKLVDPDDVEHLSLDGVLKKVFELKKEVEWLRYYQQNVYQCLGAGVDDVNTELRAAYIREKGLDNVPASLRKEYLDYKADHEED
jgi:hypothetical protein